MSVNPQEIPVECTHEPCNCSVIGPIEGEVYCSDFCRGATEGGVESDNCSCGHPQCDTA